MQRAQAVSNAAELSTELTKELDSVADRAYQLSQQLVALHEKTRVTFSEMGVQADFGPASQHHKLDRARRLTSFAFATGTARKINWPRIRSLSIERLVAETDTRSLMELFDDLAHADLEAESGYNLTESNLVKVVQLCQLLLQFMQWNVEQGGHVCQLLQEERSAAVAGMRMIPDMSLREVDQGLVKLGRDYTQLADADLDAMFVQVRTEERTGAHDTVLGVLNAAKKEVNERTAALPQVPLQNTAHGCGGTKGADVYQTGGGIADVGGSRDQGVHVYVMAGADTPPAATAAAIAAATAAAQQQQHGDDHRHGASVPYSGPYAPHHAAAGTGAGLNHADAYQDAFQGIPNTAERGAAVARAQEQQLLAARLGAPVPASPATGNRLRGGGGKVGSSLFAPEHATSLTAMVRRKQAAEAAAGGPWDSVQGGLPMQAAATGLPEGAPVQPTGLVAAMAAFESMQVVSSGPPARPHWASGGALGGQTYNPQFAQQQQLQTGVSTVQGYGAQVPQHQQQMQVQAAGQGYTNHMTHEQQSQPFASSDPFSLAPYRQSQGLEPQPQHQQVPGTSQQMGQAGRGQGSAAARSAASEQALFRPGLGLAYPHQGAPAH